MGWLIFAALRSGTRQGSKPGQNKPRTWPWQVRLMWAVAIVGTMCMFPAGRVILAVSGGLLVAAVIAALAMGFSAAGSRSGRKGPFEQYMEEQEDDLREQEEAKL